MDVPPAFDEVPQDWWYLATCGPCKDSRHDLCRWRLACVCCEPPCVDRLERWRPLPEGVVGPHCV